MHCKSVRLKNAGARAGAAQQLETTGNQGALGCWERAGCAWGGEKMGTGARHAWLAPHKTARPGGRRAAPAGAREAWYRRGLSLLGD
jgi:hypothetical protein